MGLLIGRRTRRWRSEPAETPDPQDQVKLRLTLARLAVLAAFVVLTVQLARLQLIRGDEYQQRAALNQLRLEQETPSRGLVRDRNGIPLVENVPSFSAAVVAADIPRDRTLEIAGGVEEILGVPALETVLKIEAARKSNNPFTPIIVKEGLERADAFRLREQLARLPGAQIVVEAVRHYTAGEAMSSILGYTGRIDEQEYDELKGSGYQNHERLGKAGVEWAYEAFLRGVPGSKQIEKDASGREIRVLREDPAVAGNDLILSVDLDLQNKATQLTQAAAKGGQAAAIVMDVNTGEVLALVSLPMFDNNIFSGKVDEAKFRQYLDDPKKPLVNHALAEQYAPGSIFKQITGAAALEEGVASPSTTITSNGFINVPNQYNPSVIYTFRDWRVLGTLDFYGGVAMSSDVYFYYLAGGYHEYGADFDGLGIDRLAWYTRLFGLGSPTGIEIAGEAPGNVPDAAWKEETWNEIWTLGDTYNMGIGQGFLAATPIQMVRVSAAVANGGKLLQPRVVREVRDASGNLVKASEAIVQSQIPISEGNFAIIREAMRQAVSWGTAKNGAVRGVQVAGKTGTAEFGPRFADGSYATHAWFSGFAPANDPQIAITVFLERGVGAIDAAPVAAKIMDYYFHRNDSRADAGVAPTGVQR
jgi:penicillin-binding protein 2